MNIFIEIFKTWMNTAFPHRLEEHRPDEEPLDINIYNLAAEANVSPFIAPTYTNEELKNKK